MGFSLRWPLFSRRADTDMDEIETAISAMEIKGARLPAHVLELSYR
ncbi:hypothetical protein [Xanthobacter sp. 91]|nr:hypothetical protein [Xanthobacter sp. 91]